MRRTVVAPLAAMLAAAPFGAGCSRPGVPVPAGGAGDAARAAHSDSTGQAAVEVRAALVQYYTDFSARDWPAFSAHFWPGATLTTVWQPPGEPAPRVFSVTVPEFVRQAPQGPGSKPIFAERMTNVEVRVAGTLAQAWTSYEAEFGDPGAVATWRGIDAFTLLRHDGAWRITSLAYAAER